MYSFQDGDRKPFENRACAQGLSLSDVVSVNYAGHCHYNLSCSLKLLKSLSDVGQQNSRQSE